MICPVCKARIEQGPQCRRCRADLSLLFSLQDQSRQTLAEAVRCTTQGQWHRALDLADQVEGMGPAAAETGRLRALCHLFQRDFAQAWNCYLQQSSAEE